MSKRVEWIDVAKGASIGLVVFSHALTSMFEVERPHDAYYALNFWLRQIRMPFFMMMSGILAASVLQSSWQDLWNRRLANLLWVYLLWTPLVALYTSLIDGHWQAILTPYYAPGNSLWYIAGLIFCLSLTRLMRPLPNVARLAVALMLFAASFVVAKWPISELTFAYETIIRLFVFFLIGVVFGKSIISTVNARYWLLLPVSLLGLGVMLALKMKLGVTVFGITLACTLSAIVAAYLPRLKTIFSMMGVYSLGILCTHMLILHTMTLLPGLPGPGARFWGVPLAVVVAVAGSIAVYRLTQTPPVLWKAPAAFKALRLPRPTASSPPAP